MNIHLKTLVIYNCVKANGLCVCYMSFYIDFILSVKGFVFIFMGKRPLHSYIRRNTSLLNRFCSIPYYKWIYRADRRGFCHTASINNS